LTLLRVRARALVYGTDKTEAPRANGVDVESSVREQPTKLHTQPPGGDL